MRWSPHFFRDGDEPALLSHLRSTFGIWPNVAMIFHPLRLNTRDLSFLNQPEAQVHVMAGDTDLV